MATRMEMAGTIIGYFLDQAQALEAVRQLIDHGIAANRINFVTKPETHEASSRTILTEPVDEMNEDSEAEVSKGVLAGGLFGLLAGTSTILLPGVGAVIAAGPFVSTIGATAAGAVAGGLLGLMSESGPPGRESDFPTELPVGAAVVWVETDYGSREAIRLRELLVQAGAVQVMRTRRERRDLAG